MLAGVGQNERWEVVFVAGAIFGEFGGMLTIPCDSCSYSLLEQLVCLAASRGWEIAVL